MRMRPLNKDEDGGEMIVQKMSSDSLLINGQTFTFDSVADTQATQARFTCMLVYNVPIDGLCDEMLKFLSFSLYITDRYFQSGRRPCSGKLSSWI